MSTTGRPAHCSPMKTSILGISLIQHFEQCRLRSYKDSKGIWTIGWGNTYYEDNTPVRATQTITQARADMLFKVILSRFERDVNTLLGVHAVWQYEFDALVSFAYNVGSDIDMDKVAEGLGDSTLLKKVLLNAPCDDVRREFMKWNKSGGKVLGGLVKRREVEAHLFCTGELILR